jgi:hypothetical protein
MLVELAEDLADHLGHPEYRNGRVDPDDAGPDELVQVWVPNGSHLDMLHYLAYAHIRRKGTTDDDAILRMLGRLSLHLFLESRKPGQQLVIDGTAALRSAFDFPCEDVRQGHLGLLVAWLDHRSDRDQGIAAALKAERLTVSTALDPELERKPLQDLVDRYNQSRKGRGKGTPVTEKKVVAELRPELLRRIDVLERSIDYIQHDERNYNRGLEELEAESLKSLRYLMRGEALAVVSGREPWVHAPETDWDARTAAARFFENAAAEDRAVNALIHDDRELEAEAINSGAAFRGVITKVVNEGTPQKKIPVWTLVDSQPGALSLRQWDAVCVVGQKTRTGIIREIAPTKDGSLQLVLEITNLKNPVADEEWPYRMGALDPSWLGLAVTLTGISFADLSARKARLSRDREQAPGDWMLDVTLPHTDGDAE